jgi:hypothetical protein
VCEREVRAKKKKKGGREKKRRKEKEVRYGPKSLRFAGAIPFEHAGGSSVTLYTCILVYY